MSSANFLVSLLGQLVVEVMFILLMLVLLILHAQQSPFCVYMEACCLFMFAKVDNFVNSP